MLNFVQKDIDRFWSHHTLCLAPENNIWYTLVQKWWIKEQNYKKRKRHLQHSKICISDSGYNLSNIPILDSFAVNSVYFYKKLRKHFYIYSVCAQRWHTLAMCRETHVLYFRWFRKHYKKNEFFRWTMYANTWSD